MLVIGMVVIIGIFIIDQKVKAYAREHWKKECVEGPFWKFSFVKNEGAFRGLLKGRPTLLKGIHTLAFVVLVVLLISSVFLKKNRKLSLGLAFLVAGGAGNLYDRLKHGYVTDFIALRPTGNLYYNIADFSVFIGSILSLIHA